MPSKKATAVVDPRRGVVTIEVSENAWMVPYFSSSGDTVPFGPAGRNTETFLQTLLRGLDVARLELNTEQVMTLRLKRQQDWPMAAPVVQRAICSLMGWRESDVRFTGF